MMGWLRKMLQRVVNGHVDEAAAAAEIRAQAQAQLQRVQRETPKFERLAYGLAQLPPEELAERLRRAMMRRP